MVFRRRGRVRVVARAGQDVALSIEGEGARPIGRSPGLTEEQELECREAYALFEGATRDAVPRGQLRTLVRALGVEVRKDTLARLQLGRSGPLACEEFIGIMRTIRNEQGIQEEMMRAFNRFDLDGNGRITLDNLRAVADQLGETLTEEELREMISEADMDKDGAVSAAEFVRIMKKTDVWVNHDSAPRDAVRSGSDDD